MGGGAAYTALKLSVAKNYSGNDTGDTRRGRSKVGMLTISRILLDIQNGRCIGRRKKVC